MGVQEWWRKRCMSFDWRRGVAQSQEDDQQAPQLACDREELNLVRINWKECMQSLAWPEILRDKMSPYHRTLLQRKQQLDETPL